MAIRSRSHEVTLLLLLFLFFLFAAACGGGSDTGGSGSPGSGGSPVGAWSGSGLFVCLRTDGSYGSGDHAPEAAARSGTWSSDGTLTDTNAKPVATWRLDGGSLVLQLDPPCSSDPSKDGYCGPYTLTPDSSLSCG